MSPGAKQNGESVAFHGMTLREWYAGLAMQGIVNQRHHLMLTPDCVAETAVRHADALLEALAKPREDR